MHIFFFVSARFTLVNYINESERPSLASRMASLCLLLLYTRNCSQVLKVLEETEKNGKGNNSQTLTKPAAYRMLGESTQEIQKHLIRSHLTFIKFRPGELYILGGQTSSIDCHIFVTKNKKKKNTHRFW